MKALTTLIVCVYEISIEEEDKKEKEEKEKEKEKEELISGKNEALSEV